MPTNTARYLKYGAISAGIVFVFIPAMYIAFLYFSYVDTTITTGSAYGFAIGQSKADAYRVAQSQFRSHDITGIDTIRSREDEVSRFPEVAKRYQTVPEVKDWFDSWNQWSVWLNGADPPLLAIVTFHGERVSEIRQRSQPVESWGPDDVDGLSVRVGQDYAEVYSFLETLGRAPGYESLTVDTGWMVRRQPVVFDDSEFRFVEDYNEWTLLVSDRYFNTIRLTFAENKLSRIDRHRQYFELP